MSIPALAPRYGTRRHSGLPLHWRAADFSLEAISGQDGVFTRAGTNGQGDDSEAVSYTAVHSQPCWHVDASLGLPVLRMRDTEGDQLYFPFKVTPREMTVYVAFMEGGTRGTANAILFQIGHLTTPGTDPRFLVEGTGTQYQVVHDNGTTARTAAVSGSPSTGDLVEIVARLQADGGVEIEMSINGAAASTASAGTANTLQTAWAGTYLHLNGVGTANQGDADFLEVKVGPGIRTFDEMRKAW